jgi:hypothetical protein
VERLSEIHRGGGLLRRLGDVDERGQALSASQVLGFGTNVIAELPLDLSSR